MSYRTFRKRKSNIQFLGGLFVTDTVILGLAGVYILVSYAQLSKYIFVTASVLILTGLYALIPFLGKTGRCRWRLNQLFELFAKTVSISEKMVFPVVKYKYDKGKDCYVFIFELRGKVSSGVQQEIIHRLSEALFPHNTYLLEEPLKTPAYTKYTYSRKPERLQVKYDTE